MTDRLRPPLSALDAYPLRELVRHLMPMVRRLFPPFAGGNIVDFGCGDSPYQTLFEQCGLHYVNCDLPGSQAAVIFEPNKGLPLASASADGLVSFQVLEHVADTHWYLSEAHRIIKDNGLLLLSTHGTWPYHPHPGDYRRWTRAGLIMDIEAQGFEVLEINSIVGPLAWTMLFQFMAISSLLRKMPLIGKFVSAIFSAITNTLLSAADKITPAEWATHNAAIYLLAARKK